MSSISFKGTPVGLAIRVEPQHNFEDIKEELIDSLNSAREFFSGARYNIVNDDSLDEEQKLVLENICRENGLVFSSSIALPEGTEKKINASESEENIVIKRNVRSGQRIVSGNNLIVLGNVNPGAEIIAGGDIVVMGKLKGTAHAGTKPENHSSATITAHDMQPTQIRIGNVIGCRPDNDGSAASYPEIAYVDDGRIIIGKYLCNNNRGNSVSA